MRNVDGLTRHYEHPLVKQHLKVAHQLHLEDCAARPIAYDPAAFHSHNPLKCTPHDTKPEAPATPVTDTTPNPATYTNQVLLTNLPIQF